MISTMREYFRSLKVVLLFVIIAFVATSVVYFGAASISGSNARTAGAVAVVNGEEITQERYRRAYANYVEMYRQMYKDQLTPEMAERLGLGRQVIDALVMEVLMVQQAEREGLRASDEELRSRIQAIPVFNVDGRFSRERYLDVLKQAKLTPADFERDQRREIQRRKLEAAVRDGVKVSDDEVRQDYAARRERVRAAWARLSLDPLVAQATVPDAEVEPYLKKHEARFTRAERRRVQYVVVGPRSFARPVTDGEAEAYYKEHPAEFEKPRRVKTAHVLVRVPTVGGSEAEQKSKAKVADVIKRAKAGEDFAKLAKEVSEDTGTAASGGDLGFIGKGEMVPQFEEAVFALGKGEVSPAPVRTPFGYHAIKILDVQEGGREPFKDVAPKIKDKLMAERSEKAAQARIEEVRAPLQASKDFAAEARGLGLTPVDLTMTRGDGLESIGRDGALEDAIFNLGLSGMTAPLKTAAGYVMARVVEIKPAGVPPLAEIREQVVDVMKREKAEATAVDRARAVADSVAKGGDLSAAAKGEGWTVGETEPFTRADPPKAKDALPGAVLAAALETAVGEVSAPVKAPGAVYLVRGIERQPADLSGYEAERETLRQTVLERKRGQTLESWARGLKNGAKIEISSEAGGGR